jgi:hypothetical protein
VSRSNQTHFYYCAEKLYYSAHRVSRRCVLRAIRSCCKIRLYTLVLDDKVHMVAQSRILASCLLTYLQNCRYRVFLSIHRTPELLLWLDHHPSSRRVRRSCAEFRYGARRCQRSSYISLCSTHIDVLKSPSGNSSVFHYGRQHYAYSRDNAKQQPPSEVNLQLGRELQACTVLLPALI